MTNKDFFEKIENNISLKKYNTMRVDAVAEYFLKAEEKEDIIKGIIYARENNIPFFILGNGSNIIFPSLFCGLTILMAMKNKEVREDESNIYLRVEAGALLPELAKLITEKGGSGLEWAGGVPGTIGGAVRGNAGAFEDFTGNFVKKVTVLNTETLKEEIFNKEECNFHYRESIFKKEKKYIILSVEMVFPKKDGGKEKMEEYLEYRKEKHPQEPSSGSIFKNPRVDEGFFVLHPETEKFKSFGFVPMGYLIESCGLKGKKEGGAQISEKHPNFIINTGRATKEDIEKLIDIIKKSVKEKFKIDVTEEVDLLKEQK
jgi:UDP-N-acetylmuramate dehydrogenase